MRRRAIVGAIAAMFPLVVMAQQNAADGTRLPLGRDSLTVYLIRGRDTVKTGDVRDELTRVTEGGVDYLHRVYRTDDRVLGHRLDTLVDTRLALRPLRHRSRTDRGLESVAFGDSGATGWNRPVRGDSVRVQVPLAPDVINASSVDLYLRSAPLSATYAASIVAFSPTLRRTLAINARVTGVDTVAREPSWRVQADYDGAPVMFWVGCESRRLNRQLLQLRPGVFVLLQRGTLMLARPGQRAI